MILMRRFHMLVRSGLALAWALVSAVLLAGCQTGGFSGSNTTGTPTTNSNTNTSGGIGTTGATGVFGGLPTATGTGLNQNPTSDSGMFTGFVQRTTNSGPTMLAQATVTAVEDSGAGISRTTESDANGDYLFTNLPAGSYRVGFNAAGFRGIDTSSGAAVGVNVARGAVARAATALLEPSAGGSGNDTTAAPSQPGAAQLQPRSGTGCSVTVADAATGSPLPGATVSDGTTVAVSDAKGIATLPENAHERVSLSVLLDGYQSRTVEIDRGRWAAVTVRLEPQTARIVGQLQFTGAALWPEPSGVVISVRGLSGTFTQPEIDATGAFRLTLPASTGSRSASYTLVFSAPRFNLAIASDIVPGTAGTETRTAPIILTAAP
jgi:hypothetical protein